MKHMRRARVRTAVAAVGIAAGLGLAGAVLRAGDARDVSPVQAERLLYLSPQSGRVADRLMLSFDALAADVYWIRTLQHYGRDRKSARAEGRFELLDPLLELTTTLDPQLNIAYRFGAIFLAQPPPGGPGRIDQAIALLEKGLEHNPGRWQYASDIGFIYYWYGAGDHSAAADNETAAMWFERAAAMPGAPVWLRQLAATTRVRGGDRDGARRLLQGLAASEEEWVRRAAARGLDQLKALESIDELQTLFDTYYAEHHARPASWSDLSPGQPRNMVPVDPAHVPFEFDASTNAVAEVSTLSLARDIEPQVIFPLPFGLVVVAICGLMVGSFLNVCISRLPAGESVVFPGSRCPSCRTSIRWYDNLPLLSFLLLGGRCRACHVAISRRYPIIEAVTSAAFVCQALLFGNDPLLLGSRLVFTALLVALFGTDLETQRLPNVLTIPGALLGVLFSVWRSPGPVASVEGLALGAGILLAVRWLWHRATGVDAMGLGDVKMLACIGAFLGWQQVCLVLLLASVMGAIVGVALAASGGRSLQSRLPFGTFLAVAAFGASLVGDRALAWYLGFF